MHRLHHGLRNSSYVDPALNNGLRSLSTSRRPKKLTCSVFSRSSLHCCPGCPSLHANCAVFDPRGGTGLQGRLLSGSRPGPFHVMHRREGCSAHCPSPSLPCCARGFKGGLPVYPQARGSCPQARSARPQARGSRRIQAGLPHGSCAGLPRCASCFKGSLSSGSGASIVHVLH